MEATEFHSVTMRGQTARRTVRHYGYDYGYESARVVPGEPLPEELDGCGIGRLVSPASRRESLPRPSSHATRPGRR
jgi:hypothetical protein